MKNKDRDYLYAESKRFSNDDEKQKVREYLQGWKEDIICKLKPLTLFKEEWEEQGSWTNPITQVHYKDSALILILHMKGNLSEKKANIYGRYI